MLMAKSGTTRLRTYGSTSTPPRRHIYGRVYVGTNGRGLQYGDPS